MSTHGWFTGSFDKLIGSGAVIIARSTLRENEMKLFRFLTRVLLVLFGLILTLAVGGYLYHEFAPIFGGQPDQASLKRFEQSEHYVDGVFRNNEPTLLNTRSPDRETSILEWFLIPEGKNPDSPLPSERLKQDKLDNDSFVWLGHSTIVMKTSDRVIVTDPVFNRASPVPFIANAFEMEHETRIADLPYIDAVLISHDHYDHLDYRGIKDLAHKVSHFFVPLGIKAHLQRWGIPDDKITEMDWFESASYQGVTFVLTPARHFSGRRFTNQSSTLWGAWVIQSSSMNVYFSGDGGYSEDLLKIGEQYGPFDITFVENGAYNLDWAQIHMLPEEAVQAAIDLNSKLLFPIHWGKFDLALHPWNEPIIRLTEEAKKRNVEVATPLIGEVFSLESYPKRQWW